MECFQFPIWQNPYLDAALELDTHKLSQRVIAAERAVLSRAQQLENLITDDDERVAINDALKSLRILRGLFEWV